MNKRMISQVLLLLVLSCIGVNCQDGSAQIVTDATGSAQIIGEETGSAQIIDEGTGSAQIVTSDNNSTIDSQTFTYIPLRDLLSLETDNLTSPCASASEFRNYIENIDRWTQILSYPDELSGDFVLLGEVRRLIVAARDSANQVQQEFEIQVLPSSESLLQAGEQVFAQVQMTTPLNAFLQVSSKVELKTQVIQGLFYKEIQSILTKLAQIQQTQDLTIDQQSQEILDAIDRLTDEINEVLGRQSEFEGWILQLSELRNQVIESSKECSGAGSNANSSTFETDDQYLDGQPSSATIDTHVRGSAEVVSKNQTGSAEVVDNSTGRGSVEVVDNSTDGGSAKVIDDGLGSAEITKVDDGLGSAEINKVDNGTGSLFIDKQSNEIVMAQQATASRSPRESRKSKSNLRKNKYSKNL